MTTVLVLAALLAAAPQRPPVVPRRAQDERSLAARGLGAAGVDRTADPCTDFHAFASGVWRAGHPLPPGAQRSSPRSVAREANATALEALLAELAARRDWPAGSAEQLAGDAFAACMDERAGDAAGLTPVAPLLASLEAIRTRADVQRAIRQLHAMGIGVGFTAAGGFDYHAPRAFMLGLSAGALGLPDPAQYLGAAPQAAAARARYGAYLARLLELGGTPRARADEAAAEILALETRLAKEALDPAAAQDPAQTDHRTTFAGLQALAPHLDWATYLDEAGLPRADVNVAEPKLLAAFDRELGEAPVATWRSYLTARLLDAAAPWLTRPFAEEAFAFRDAFLGGVTAPPPRGRRCAAAVEELLPDPVGKVFVARYFPEATRKRVQVLAANLLAVLREEVERVEWMAPATRATALAKLAGYVVELGHPERFRDLRGVLVRRDSPWGNVVAAKRFAVADDRRQVGRPSDPGRWQLPASSSAAYLDLQLNAIVLPAGFLRGAFDPDATDAFNYGWLGSNLAHDMTHVVDTLGAENDVLGRPVTWWTAADQEGFAARARCVADQASAFEVRPGLHLDGQRVLREAVGDLEGVRIAHAALLRSMAARPVPAVDGFSPEQQFFIAAAQSRAETLSEEAERRQVATDSHPVSRFRAIAPLSNLPGFQAAFSCEDRSPMVRPPAQRCAIWVGDTHPSPL